MNKGNIKFIWVIISMCLVFSSYTVSTAELPFYQSDRTLRYGMSGGAVRSLQSYLADQGIYPKGLITGYFGRITELSVKVFQLKSDIEPTGIVGPKTRTRIQNLVLSAGIALPSPLVVATSTEVGDVVVTVATSTDLSKYVLAPKPDYDLKKLANEVQNLVNDKRVEIGLSPVYWDEELAGVAEEHSQDQARDNIQLTDSVLVCHYPIIRHEGLTVLGYSLKERYDTRNIKYRYGGENIAMLPASKDLLYVQAANEPSVECKDVEKFTVGHGTEPEAERLAFLNKVKTESLDAMKDLKPVNWVQKSWRTNQEIAQLTVDGWMNSPGHRDNILRKEYTVAGIGISMVNDYMIITHNFVGR